MIDFDKLKISEVPVDFDSPISAMVSDMSKVIAERMDNGVMNAVVNVGFNIDKDKLVQILQQDKERYSEAYRKGHMDGYRKRDDEIIRCRDCKHLLDYDITGELQCNIKMGWFPVKPDWYCADAERKEDDEE